MYDYFNLFILIYKIINLLPVGVICRCRNASRSSEVKYIYLRYIRTLTLKRFKYQRGAFQKAWDSFFENVFPNNVEKGIRAMPKYAHSFGWEHPTIWYFKYTIW